MDMQEALHISLAESRELLQDMEASLLALSAADEPAELINAVFRAAHTIKGSSGLFNLHHIVAFTHVAESVLDRVRDGRVALDAPLVALLLSCGDHIGALIEGVAAGQTEADPALAAQGLPLLDRLRAHLDAGAAPTASAASPVVPSAAPGASAHAADDPLAAAPADGLRAWQLSLRFGPEVLRNGMDPLSFIQFLGTLAQIRHVQVLADALPSAPEMDPEACYLAYEIALDSAADPATIEGAFEFVRDDCELRLVPRTVPAAAGADTDALAGVQPSVPAPVAPSAAAASKVTAPATSAVAALAKPGAVPKPGAPAQEVRSIRIDADKLDQLINLVGELIIVGAGVNLIARRANIADLQEHTSKLSSLVEEVRDSALQLRMVKIGATFSRFQRVVHDVSRDIGKDIALVIQGEDTELDKTVVEKIGDPLMHLVRNAMDHGIESAELRLARGKPAQGTVTLNAFHDSGSIVITVEDDGGGLPRERILAKAIERGLVEPGHHLSDSEVYGLIFEPGFSTAEAVTNLSGRGVGMDVVKRNITSLRGSVGVTSQEGRGTTVTVRLPLTLAIIDGFLVQVDDSVFAIPLDMIEECVAFSAEPGHNYTNLRGQVLPFIRLRELFELDDTCAKRRENIVVLKHAGQKAGLVVDTLLGEFQTVIKPLGKLFSQVRCISGSTILGSGEVALILDVPALIQQAVSAASLHDKNDEHRNM